MLGNCHSESFMISIHCLLNTLLNNMQKQIIIKLRYLVVFLLAHRKDKENRGKKITWRKHEQQGEKRNKGCRKTRRIKYKGNKSRT